MRVPRSVAAWVRVSSIGACALLLPAIASAQDERPSALPFAIGAGIILVCVVFMVLFYAYLALALQTIANKTNTENAWFAWIPILNAILILNVANKPLWWLILLLIPGVNIVVGIIVWMAVAEARNKPSWWGIMVIVPVMNLIMPGYLAWSD